MRQIHSLLVFNVAMFLLIGQGNYLSSPTFSDLSHSIAMLRCILGLLGPQKALFALFSMTSYKQ